MYKHPWLLSNFKIGNLQVVYQDYKAGAIKSTWRVIPVIAFCCKTLLNLDHHGI